MVSGQQSCLSAGEEQRLRCRTGAAPARPTGIPGQKLLRVRFSFVSAKGSSDLQKRGLPWKSLESVFKVLLDSCLAQPPDSVRRTGVLYLQVFVGRSSPLQAFCCHQQPPPSSPAAPAGPGWGRESPSCSRPMSRMFFIREDFCLGAGSHSVPAQEEGGG